MTGLLVDAAALQGDAGTASAEAAAAGESAATAGGVQATQQISLCIKILLMKCSAEILAERGKDEATECPSACNE